MRILALEPYYDGESAGLVERLAELASLARTTDGSLLDDRVRTATSRFYRDRQVPAWDDEVTEGAATSR